MPLYYCPAIKYGTTTVWLPPGLRITTARSQEVRAYPIPRTSSAVIGSVTPNQGMSIRIEVDELANPVTQAKALEVIRSLWTHMKGRTFTLWIFSDRAWVGCALRDLDDDTLAGDGPSVRIRARLEIYCPYNEADTSQQLAFDDYDEDYPYAAFVGRPLGDAVSPTDPEEGVIVPTAQQTFPGKFEGLAEVTPNGGGHRFIVGGPAGSQWRVKRAIVSRALVVDSEADETELTVSDVDVDDMPGAKELVFTVAGGVSNGAVATGNLLFTAGDEVFVHITASDGGHADVQFVVMLEAE